jgi:mannose-6-phosphate isomerase-like protein (cupin superfamily)
MRIVPGVLMASALFAGGFSAGRWCPPGGVVHALAEGPLPSGLVRTRDAVPTRGEWGEWLRYFKGQTHGTTDLVVLAVTLKPGQAPHPPHRHAEEEFMILAEGSGRWHLDGKDSPAVKGDAVYAAPWSMHGIKNTGDGPLTYYMVKWSGKGVEPPAAPGEAGDGQRTERSK